MSRCVTGTRIRPLPAQYLWYSAEDGGEFRTPVKGIPESCPLSPLTGAGLLYHIDCGFSNREGIYYARCMDDFLILTQTRRPLRRSIARLNDSPDVSGSEQHPDRTITGRITRRSDRPGAWFEPGAAGLAPRSLRLRRERCLRLYEQACCQGLTHEESMARVHDYRQRRLKHAGKLLP